LRRLNRETEERGVTDNHHAFNGGGTFSSEWLVWETRPVIDEGGVGVAMEVGALHNRRVEIKGGYCLCQCKRPNLEERASRRAHEN